jgi:hypothetical protein
MLHFTGAGNSKEMVGCNTVTNTRVYPKVSGLAAWSENANAKLSLGAVVSLFCESV